MSGPDDAMATPAQPTRGLSEEALHAIADLEARVVAHDGGRLKLEWSRLRARSGERAEDVLAWDAGQLVGFAGLYGFEPQIEIAGMVDPAHRRRGIGGALLDAARTLCTDRDVMRPLVIVARDSAGGRALVQARGAQLEHSEHALVLDGAPTDGPDDPELTLRTAERADIPALLRLLTDGFGWAPTDVGERLHEADVTSLVIERGGAPIGTIRVQRTGDVAAVYGFVVDAAWRGRGIGRDVLRRVCREQRADGARQIALEVAVENDRALHLYTSLGFVPVTTEDYWELPADRT